jgi:UDP-N-acetylglucosamine--N-acetylmuramyl-(pentapeptide) pyrophosphoryl-undecaprenol N-acetylglucosamine transferase
LVVSRAGGAAIFEILSLGIPSILVPFPFSAEGHQDLNAEVLQNYGAAICLKDKDLGLLSKTIKLLVNDKEKLKVMGIAAKNNSKPDASKKLVEMINAAD